MAAVACSLLLFSSACSVRGGATTPENMSPLAQPTKTQRADRCLAADVERTVIDLFSSYNGGERDLVERYMAPDPNWGFWRDPASGGEPVPRNRLNEHLQSLYRDGVRLRIERLVFTGRNSTQKTGDFMLRLARDQSTSSGNAKGAVDCETQKLSVMTIDNW